MKENDVVMVTDYFYWYIQKDYVGELGIVVKAEDTKLALVNMGNILVWFPQSILISLGTL